MNEHLFDVVSVAFVVIIGVAVERFLTEFPLKHDPALRHPDPRAPRGAHAIPSKLYHICYVLSLTAIVTLVLRFLIGSDSHLRRAYTACNTKPAIDNFIVDICFLMLFGAFIVGAALARRVHWFALWLALFSGVAVLWSSIATTRGAQAPLIRWWLTINAIQFGISLAAMVWSLACRNRHNLVIAALLIVALWYVVIFPFDLEHILLGPGQKDILPKGEKTCSVAQGGGRNSMPVHPRIPPDYC